MSILLLIIGFILLIKGADYFVDGCSAVAKAFGIPSLIIGLTVVSFGTSAPEAAVSIAASLEDMNEIALGNAVGSNICNLLLVLGFSGLFGTLTAKRKVITRDFIYAIFATIVLVIITSPIVRFGRDTGSISRTNGLLLLAILLIYIFALLSDAFKSIRKKEKKEKFELKNIPFIILGLVGIIFGGELVVDSATKIAEMLHIGHDVIALTVVAIGTSLPELVTSSIAAKKGEVDLAIGNVIGSNIFNILFVLGLSSLISPISYNLAAFIDILIMLAVSVLVYLLVLHKGKIGRTKSCILLCLYITYMAYLFVR